MHAILIYNYYIKCILGLTGGAIIEASAQVIAPSPIATHWHLIAAAASMNGSYCCSGHDSMMRKM